MFLTASRRSRAAPAAWWGIETQCDWTLDMVFQEDQNRTRKDHGPANLAMIRRRVLSILRQDSTRRYGRKARV